MQILKGELNNIKGIPPSGLCVGVHRAGAIHQKMVAKYGDRLSNAVGRVAVLSRLGRSLISSLSKRGLGEQGIRSTDDMDSIDASSEKLIYGVRGAPPEVRENARQKGLTLLADATCPFVTQQEEAELELLGAGCHLVARRAVKRITAFQGFRGLREKRAKKFLLSSAKKTSIRFV